MNNDKSVEAEQLAEGRARETGIPTVFFGETEDQRRRRVMTSLYRNAAATRTDLDALPTKSGVVTFEEVFQDIFDEAFDLLVERQKKYGPENVKKLGLYGLFTRIEDKMERLRHAFNGTMDRGVFNLTETDDSSDESLDDGDIDAANYHLIRVALRRGLWGRPLEEDANGAS